MRTIDAKQIVETVAGLLVQACNELPADVEQALRAGREAETTPRARSIMDTLLENARIAREQHMPICQDTGVAFVLVELGGDVHIAGGLLDAAVQDGVRLGTERGYLRRSIVRDPIRRENTGDNAPGTIFVLPVAGDRVRITVAPKGAGCENMSRLAMLTPSTGIEGVKKVVMDTVRDSGANACPPLVVGIGLGGDFASAPLLAKKAMLRTMGNRHADALYAELERELLDAINGLGLGPQALGGKTMALDVFVEFAPCHIASLPVAVCLNCHAARHATAVL